MNALPDPADGTSRATIDRSWLFAFAVSLVTALLVVSPFFRLGTASGHDFQFHAASWLDAASQWKEGILYPRWTEGANHGFGEPRFIFYPPLSWMLGAALSFVVPWNAVPAVFIAIAQTIAGLCTFALARRLLPPRAALFAAACYATNPYALLVVYMRSDFAEQLACALMPLMFLSALQLAGIIEDRQHSTARTIAFFSLSFAAVWLSNAPAGVMASYSVALLFGWAAVSSGSLKPLSRGGAGLALGFGLASFYLIPAAYEQRWVNIAQALSSGLLPSENFLYTSSSDAEHTAFNFIASSVAILLAVITAVAAAATRQPGRQQDAGTNGNRRWWTAFAVLTGASILMMLRITSVLWTLLPKLRFVQFPWRWMAVLAVPYAIFLAAAAARSRRIWIWAAAAAIWTIATGGVLVHRAWWDTEDIPVLRQAIADDQGFEGTDEYDPAGDDHYNLPDKAPRAQFVAGEQAPAAGPAASIQILRWTAEDREVEVHSPHPAQVALRLLNYPAWQVEINGAEVSPGHAEESAQMILPVPAGLSQIRIHFARTPDRTLGGGVSVLSVVVLGVLFWSGGRRPSEAE